MTLLIFAFFCGLIAANWIRLSFDEQFVELLSNWLHKAKLLAQKGIELGWSHYQAHQSKDLPPTNGAIAPLQI